MLTGALSRTAERALPLLPGVLIGPFAEVFGTLAYLSSPGARRNVRSNLAVIAPDRKTSARRVFVEQTRNYVEIFSIPHIKPERLLASLRVEGWEHVAHAYELGKGVILASAHLGSVSFVGQLTLAHGLPVALPVEVIGDIRNPYVVPLGPRAISDQLLGIFERTLKLPGKLSVPEQPKP